MSWKQIVSSVLLLSVSYLITILPFKDFNIIKKESGIKFDGNQAFNKVFSNFFEKNQDFNNSLKLQNEILENKIHFLEKTNLQLKELNLNLYSKIQEASQFSLIDNKWFMSGCIFIFFSCFIAYKYIRLKKMHKNVLNLTNIQIESSKKIFELYKNFKIKNNELSDYIEQMNQRLENTKRKLEDPNCIKFDKDSLKQKIKTCCFSTYLKSCKNFQLGLNCRINKSKLETFQNKLDNLSIKWYNNLMKPVFVLTESTSNSVLLLSIVTSFILITYIDFNFQNVLDSKISAISQNTNTNTFMRSEKDYFYDFLKIDDYIWKNNEERENLSVEVDRDFFKNRSWCIDKAIDHKKQLLTNKLINKKNFFIDH